MNHLQYFTAHPEARENILKAFYAYHTHHPRHHEGAHHFSGPYRDSDCQWCGRTRELVRWDDLPAQCQQRPDAPDIAEVMRGEEEKAWALIVKAEREVPRLIARMGMSGETLAVLHHTHGFTPELFPDGVEVPAQVIADYNAAMEIEQQRSRAAIKRQVVTAL